MKKKIAIIGMARLGRKHLSELRRSDYFDLVAICDNDINGEEFTRFEVFNDIDMMFSVINPEAVLIATHAKEHKEIILKCMKYTKNIFIESPLGNNLAEAREINYAKKTNDLNLAIGYKDRFNPAILSILRELEKNKEEIYSINFVNSYNFDDIDGDLISVLIRDIDLLRVISNSEVSKFNHIKINRKNITSCISANAKTSNDIIVSFLCSLLYPNKKHTIEISTNLGVYIADLINFTLHKNTQTGRINLKVDNEDYSLRFQHKLFYMLCDNKEALGLANVEDVIKAMEIIK